MLRYRMVLMLAGGLLAGCSTGEVARVQGEAGAPELKVRLAVSDADKSLREPMEHLWAEHGDELAGPHDIQGPRPELQAGIAARRQHRMQHPPGDEEQEARQEQQGRHAAGVDGPHVDLRRRRLR